MVSYPLTTTFVQPGEPLALVLRVLQRPDDHSVAQVAAANDCSEAHLYDLIGRCREGLRPQRPGPAPDARKILRLEARVAELEAERARDRVRIADLERRLDGAVHLDPKRLARMEVVMAANNVTLRGMREVLTIAFGAHVAPSLGTLHAHVKSHGRKARALGDRAREQVRGAVTDAGADDVFLANVAVKVVNDLRSNAILRAGRWRWRKGEDWKLWLDEYPNLRLVACDLGSDLTAALDLVRVERGPDGRTVRRLVYQIVDYWHEMDWWATEVFRPLAKLHHEQEERILSARKKMRKLSGEERTAARNAIERAERVRARTEREFYFACEAELQVRALYEPLRPDGMPWTAADVTAAIDAIRATLRQIVHAVGWRARKHIETHASRYGSHRVLMDEIEVRLRAGSAWTRRDVLRALSHERELRRRSNDMAQPAEAMMRADREARRLAAALRRHCVNHAAVRARWEDLVDTPRRSSSGTESFNNRLRVLQTVQRNVSDDRIALHMLEHNLTVRREGPRRGRSPYQILGVDFANTEKPWYDVLLDDAA